MAARAPPPRYFSDENEKPKNIIIFFFLFAFCFAPSRVMTALSDFLFWVSLGT